MERVSGWYKRRIHFVLAVIGLGATIILNADTVQIARKLWSDETVRAAVVAEADKITTNGQNASDLKTVADQVKEINTLNIPLGWKLKKGDPTRSPHSAGLWAAMLIGILMTTHCNHARRALLVRPAERTRKATRHWSTARTV